MVSGHREYLSGVALIVLLFLHGCGGGSATDPTEQRRSGATLVEVLEGDAIVDTVGAESEQPVVARVVYLEDGQPIANRDVTVSVPRTVPGVWLRASEDDAESGELALTSDAQGEFQFFVTLRTVAGRATVEMRPAGGFATTKQIFVDISPGSPVEIALEPAAEAVTAGDSVRLISSVLDQHGNEVPSDIVYSTAGPGTVSNRYVVGTDPGLVTATAGAGPFSASVDITVVPAGRIVYYTSVDRWVRSMQLDGSEALAIQFFEDAPDVAADPTGGDAVVGVSALWVTDFSQYRQVTGDSPYAAASLPRYSPDGTLVYFMAEFSDRGPQIWRISLDGGSVLEQVTQAPSVDDAHRFPGPSNQGDRLVYASTTAQSLSGPLILRDLGSGGETPLGVEGQSSRWSPDDQWIAYLDPGSELRRIRPDGSDDQPIAPDLVVHRNFAWLSDGGFIVASEASGSLVLVAVEEGWTLPVPRPHPVRGVDVYPGS